MNNAPSSALLNHQSPLEQRRASPLLSSLMGLGIVLLAAVNGFFTYSGALLYVEEPIYALLFAGAVQFAIAMTLLALPYVRGFGKVVLILVYAAALFLSTMSAYTYVYNASLPGDLHSTSIDTSLKAEVSSSLATALKAEQQALDAEYQRIEQIRRSAEEEAARGLNSGMGPGKGREYFQKLERYEDQKTAYEARQAQLEEAKKTYSEITQALANGDNELTREELLASLSTLRSKLRTVDADTIVERALNSEVGVIKTPIERAYEALRSPENYNISVVVSLVWAAVFDLLALFLGIIRYYLVHTSTPILQRLYASIVAFVTFLFKLGHIRADARQQFKRQQSLADMPLNSTEMQNFATYLLSGSQLSLESEDEADKAEPIRQIIKYMEPLNLEKNPNAVGIPWENISSEPRLSPLISMLVQSGVLKNNPENEAYLLDSSPEMSQKVLVLMRLGMKEQPENMAGVEFLIRSRAGEV